MTSGPGAPARESQALDGGAARMGRETVEVGMDPDRRFEAEALPNLDAVHRFALRLTGDESGAEDLVQETFLRAYRSWHQFTPGTNCKSWLFTICRNVHLRNAERTKRHQEIVERESEDDPRSVSRENPVFMSTQPDDPEGSFFASIVDHEVLRAIEELPEEHRLAVVLADQEELSYQEISNLLEIPVGTVKSRLFRGRRALQRRLRDYAVSMGFLPARDPRGHGQEEGFPEAGSEGERA